MKGVTLVSGGIDSPVSTHLLADKAELVPLYFTNYPFSGEDTKDRAIASVKKLQGLHDNIPDLVILPHGQNLEAFASKCERRMTCVLCKRMMVRVASAYAKSVGASFLVMGDSLGQVASQTLTNLAVVEQAASLPVVRPLIGLDKEEIIRIAREIGTFGVSTSSAMCCSIVPDKPSTAAVLEAVLEEEKKVDIAALVAQTLKGL